MQNRRETASSLTPAPNTTIRSIELLSTGWTTSLGNFAITELDNISKKYHNVIGIIAYHTLDGKYPISGASNLLKCLKANSSYLCVGWRDPTDFDSINELHKLGITYHVDVVKSTSFPSELDPLHRNLMHSKILIFSSPKKSTCTVVIGSHNWTRSALTGTSSTNGLNLEDSVIIEVGVDHQLVIDARKRIEEVKYSCIEYKSHLLDAFKRLQYGNSGRLVLEVETDLPKNCKELILYFEDRNQSTTFSLDKGGFLVNKSSGETWEFTSDGSISSDEVGLKPGKRQIAKWSNTRLKHKRINKGTPLPNNDYIAILSLKKKNKGNLIFMKPRKKGHYWANSHETRLAIENSELKKDEIKIQRLRGLPEHPDDYLIHSDLQHLKKFIIQDRH